MTRVPTDIELEDQSALAIATRGIQAALGADEGRKDDAGKAPFHLIPPEVLFELAEVLRYGEAKYAARNWEKGMHWSRPFSAAMRHLWAWWRGEDLDPESGLPHLSHAICCVAFLVAYRARGAGTDDRP